MLDTLFTYFARYGYFVVFLGVMLENAGVPVPGGTILLAAGSFAAQGNFHIWSVMAIATFGAMLAALSFIMLALVWRWLVHHEDWNKKRLAAFLARPRIYVFRRRYAAQIAFVQDRLTPESYLGLHLTISAIILIGSAWLIGGIAACLIILLVAFSRMCLGLHYLSDVLAAMVEGLARLALSPTAVETVRRRKQMLNTHIGQTRARRQLHA